MLNKLLNRHLLHLIAFNKRSVTIQSEFDLVQQMKLLNNNKQFKETLELFDKHNEKNIDQFSNYILTQVLKACSGLGDLQRGSNIHRLVSSRLKNDSFLLTSVIHLYSKF
jgi:hypothetical protein